MSFLIVLGLVALVALMIVFGTFVTVQQGTVAIITIFGRYSRILRPGLNVKIPFIEAIYRRFSVQNRSAELAFQAITQDQANVHFKALLVYAVLDTQEETLKNVAFKFESEAQFMVALTRTIEGSVRGFVATKKQYEILSLRNEIVHDVKNQLDQVLESWGYHLIDLQLNDVTFDDAITRSMAQVVASANLKAAAENEGQALLITKTKAAEAEGNAVKISAEAERIAAQLRGQGMALFRKEVAKGMADAAQQMQTQNLDASFLLFSMWTEAIKNFAEAGEGNTIFLDGSPEGMERVLKQIMVHTQRPGLGG